MIDTLTARFQPRVTFRSLYGRNFRLWFVGQTTSMTGQWLGVAAQAILVLDLGGSGTVLGIVGAMQYLPMLLIGPWAGVACDRFDKRRLLASVGVLTVITSTALGVLVMIDRVTIGGLFVFAAALGALSAFEQPARRTIVTELVDDADGPNAVGLNSAIVNLSRVLGPLLAAVTIAWAGTSGAFLANAASSIVLLAAMAMMDASSIRRPPHVPNVKGQITEGFRVVARNPTIRRPLLLVSAVGFLGFNWNVLVPLLVTRDLDRSVTAYGVLSAVMSFGALLGTLWQARQGVPNGRTLSIAAVAFGAAMMLVAPAPEVITVGLALALVGVTSMTFFTGSVVALQITTAPSMRGRVMAIFGMASLGSVGLGAPLSGWVAERASARAAFGLAGATGVLLGVAMLALDRRAATDQPPLANQLDQSRP